MSDFMLLECYKHFFFKQIETGSYRCHWKHEGRNRRFLTVKTFQLVLALARREFPEEGESSDALAPGLPPMDAALVLYPRLMRHRGKKAGERRIKDVARMVRRILRFHKSWRKFTDVTEEGLNTYLDERRKVSEYCAYQEVSAFLGFLRRHQRAGYLLPSWVTDFENPEPETKELHKAWPEDRYLKWIAYLTRGMEILARANATWCWRKRVSALCETREFMERMMLLVPHVLQARALFRPGESRKVNTEDWNGQTRMLKLSSQAAKCAMKSTIVDDESAWLYDVCCLGRASGEPLAEYTAGHGWSESTLGATMRRHLDAAGMQDCLPYDVKYTIATFIYDNPDLFHDEGHEKRLERVRALIGHEENSKITERYIKSRWGSPFSAQMVSFFNHQKIFPFDVKDFPVEKYAPRLGGDNP